MKFGPIYLHLDGGSGADGEDRVRVAARVAQSTGTWRVIRPIWPGNLRHHDSVRVSYPIPAEMLTCGTVGRAYGHRP